MSLRSPIIPLCTFIYCTLVLAHQGDAFAHQSSGNSRTELAATAVSSTTVEVWSDRNENRVSRRLLAFHPRPRRYRSRRYPFAPTLHSMQNHMFQSHQWRGDYPVCQPLHSTTYGHHGTRWRHFQDGPQFPSFSMPDEIESRPRQNTAQQKMEREAVIEIQAF